MPQIREWVFETFEFGEFRAQKISFLIDEHEYLMFFSPFSVYKDSPELVEFKEREFGMQMPPLTFEVKFDRADNFESDQYFQQPDTDEKRLNFNQLKRLGDAIKQILRYHLNASNAQLYLAIAENPRLRPFYRRLAKTHAQALECIVTDNLGEEGLGYAIRTPYYQS